VLLGRTGHVVRYTLDKAVSFVHHGGFLLSSLMIEFDCQLFWGAVVPLFRDYSFSQSLGLSCHVLGPKYDDQHLTVTYSSAKYLA
jgi:hypothetical protein